MLNSNVGLFDPLGNLVAQGKSISDYIATSMGNYVIAIADVGDTGFHGDDPASPDAFALKVVNSTGNAMEA